MTFLNRFEQAVREHALKGARRPQEWPRIDGEYEKAKFTLLSLLGYLERNQAKP